MKNKMHLPAGTIHSLGYWEIHYNQKLYKAHRIAWYLVHDIWLKPEQEIDHINGIRSDNRMENLRIVSVALQQQNRKEHRHGHLWGTAFHWRCPKKPWQGRVLKSGKMVSLGYFKSQIEAHDRAVSFAKENGILLLGG